MGDLAYGLFICCVGYIGFFGVLFLCSIAMAVIIKKMYPQYSWRKCFVLVGILHKRKKS